MEDIIRSIVNLGIGVIKTVEDGFQVNASDLQGILAEIVAKGDQATDENSQKVKDLSDMLINMIAQGEARARELADSVVSAMSDFDISTLTQDVRTKIEELIAAARGGQQS